MTVGPATPMFPLGTVLLPGGALPLHVFEPRYRQLVHDLLADDGDPEFGVVLIERGHEVGGGDARAAVGTMARIVDAHVTADGRFALLTFGTQRVRVQRWLPDAPYPRADLEPWPDEPAAADLSDRLAELHREVGALRSRLGLPAEDSKTARPADESDPVAASYRLAAAAPIGPADAYRVLCAPGPGERLDVLAAALDDVRAALDFGREP